MTPNEITLLVFFWILIGLFVDRKRNGYDYDTKQRLGWAEETPCRWTAFIFAPFNFGYILGRKFIETIFINKW